jgi:hypothetical protein
LLRPSTLGDPANAPASGYNPIDPLPVILDPGGSAATNEAILKALPDETMRMAIGEIDRNGSLAFGPAKTGVKDHSYIVIVDYIKFVTQPFEAEIAVPGPGRRDTIVFNIRGFAIAQPTTVATDSVAKALVPVYVGVGLRLTATVTVRQGSVDLGNLFALGFAAQAQKATGTLTVQTLGISGPTVSGVIPMPSDINPTTIQNAILALGSIKAKLYDPSTLITPRVVGVYNTLGGGQRTINSFISALLRQPIIIVIR